MQWDGKRTLCGGPGHRPAFRALRRLGLVRASPFGGHFPKADRETRRAALAPTPRLLAFCVDFTQWEGPRCGRRHIEMCGAA